MPWTWDTCRSTAMAARSSGFRVYPVRHVSVVLAACVVVVLVAAFFGSRCIRRACNCASAADVVAYVPDVLGVVERFAIIPGATLAVLATALMPGLLLVMMTFEAGSWQELPGRALCVTMLVLSAAFAAVRQLNGGLDPEGVMLGICGLDASRSTRTISSPL